MGNQETGATGGNTLAYLLFSNPRQCAAYAQPVNRITVMRCMAMNCKTGQNNTKPKANYSGNVERGAVAEVCRVWPNESGS